VSLNRTFGKEQVMPGNYPSAYDQTVRASRPVDKKYRVEWASLGQFAFHLFTKARSYQAGGEPGMGASYWDLSSATKFAGTRSKEMPANVYRVVDLQARRVVAVYLNGDLKEVAGKEETVAGARYRAEFYISEASQGPSSRSGSGMYAPEEPGGRWQASHSKSRQEAEDIYYRWTTARRGGFKRSRIVEERLDGTSVVIMDSLYDGGAPPEGATSMNGTTVEEPLTIPRTTMIAKIEAAVEKDRVKFAEDQQKLLDEAHARLQKITTVNADQWLVLKLIEKLLGGLEGFHDEDEVYKAVSDYFGKQPGTAEFSPNPSAISILSALKAAIDDNIMVKTNTDLYQFLSQPDAEDTGAAVDES